MKTYDIHFNSENASNNKGFNLPLEQAKSYIRANNGSNNSYFEDFKGGIVSVVCNEPGETEYQEEIV